jgi:hypothetical protein
MPENHSVFRHFFLTLASCLAVNSNFSFLIKANCQMKSLTITFYTFLVSIFLNFLALNAQAQQEMLLELSWKSGIVVLASGDTISGSVVLTTPRDIIKVTTLNSGARFYSPADVSSFDVSGMLNKGLMTNKEWASKMGYEFHYQTYLWNQDRDYGKLTSPAFFIVVKPGNYSLLMRLVKETDMSAREIGSSTLRMAAGYGARKIAKSILGEKLYLRSPENKVIALRKPKEDIKRIFAQYFKQIDDYAQTYNLRFNNTTDLARIIAYVNSLNP